MLALVVMLFVFQNPSVSAKDSKGEDKSEPAKKENPPAKLTLQPAPINREGSRLTSFSPIIKRVTPSVVNIFSSKKVAVNRSMRNHPLFNDPMFRRFFGEQGDGEEETDDGRRPKGRTRQEQSLGSGVIVTTDGYILTNNHVVEGADEIQAVLTNGKEFKARLVGTDLATDTAVLKIEAQDLPALPLSNSDNLEVGDIVLAIGNPFGLGQTVTMGIISAIGRGDLGIMRFEDFIQTDASINPGNSGGALVDADGRLVGINTAILSRSGGNQGVGFAVPVNLARAVIEGLVSNGKVSRGYLGVQPQRLDPELMKQFGLSDQNGALVTEVAPNTPAQEAGIKVGDVILEVNGKKIIDDRNLRMTVSQMAPKTSVPVKVVRDGKEKTIIVKLGELPTMMAGRGEEAAPDEKVPESDSLDGVEVADLDARMRRQFSVPASVTGAVVTSVDEDSTSFTAGLREGDVILELNKKAVTNAEDAIKMSAKVKGDRTLLRVYSKGGSKFLSIENKKTER